MTISNFMERAVEATKSRSIARAARRSLTPSFRTLVAQQAALYGAHVAPGEMVFDIGVGDGLQSEIFLACKFNTIGVEPNPSLRGSISRKFGHDPRFEFVAKKLGARPGLEEVSKPLDDSSQRDSRLRLRLSHRNGPVARKWVEVTTLDAVIGHYGRPRLCRVNEAGSEAEVLSGLSQPIPFISFSLSRDRSDGVSACLYRLASTATIRVNLNCFDSGSMLYPRWLTAAVFIKMLQDGHVPSKADCWIAMGNEDF